MKFPYLSLIVTRLDYPILVTDHDHVGSAETKTDNLSIQITFSLLPAEAAKTLFLISLA